ncbi:FKBP-type peptidyl-prolyl cis-trans isomerase [Pacificimonas sp. WHA3]|uniref:Peptidyl-prolyl cis-trans isomerase n=1 Tax=Pacificimonas pallii TaxID=2827236 RepID=A0ABS6SEY9_9SPHN|nr:FKBP-type peptidyl-prolyl cis-trans isomerase [Pacificimonas pallii]MBV7256973.1 FKBP-type peptidyl-prolyl cis-trans isomerase [Pacificimonas pallii]
MRIPAMPCCAIAPYAAACALIALTTACAPRPARPAATDAPPAASLDPDSAWLHDNAAKVGVRTLPGLQYEIVESGPEDGVPPTLSDDVTVHYEGRLVNGEIFDSSFERGEPSTFPLRRLIPGWGIALRLMRPGDEWIVTIPPEMAYGAKGVGPIPGDSVLIFRIRLIEHSPTPKTPSPPEE